MEEAFNAYLSDFVHMVYRSHSGQKTADKEFTLALHSLETDANMLIKQCDDSMLTRLVALHKTHGLVRRRLAHFQSVNQVFRECSNFICRLQDDNPTFNLLVEDEYTLDVVAVRLLIENLKPAAPSQLTESAGQTQWLAKVHTYRPVVEKIFAYRKEAPQAFGVISLRSLDQSRCLWTRVVIVKYFIEHVCRVDGQDKQLAIRNCHPLWMFLGEHSDMKQVDFLEKVMRFLTLCNKEAVAAYGVRSSKVQQYQTRCNHFFMDVVSQLCFADNTAPSDAVVDKLVEYITLTSGSSRKRPGSAASSSMDFSIFIDSNEARPVLRSFLLHLLLRTSEQRTRTYLSKYLAEAKNVTHGNSKRRNGFLVDLSLLIIQCLEDMLFQKFSQTNDLGFVVECLLKSAKRLLSVQLNTDKLYSLAYTRFGLAITAQYLHHTSIEPTTAGTAIISDDVQSLFTQAREVCQIHEFKWPKEYLVKYMCRRYGTDSYYTIVKTEPWLDFENLEHDKVKEVPDRYLVSGTSYIGIREAISKVVFGHDTEKLKAEINAADNDTCEIQLCLALHREITMSYLQENKVHDKDHVQKILQNRVGQNCHRLNVIQGQSLRQQGTVCLLFHFCQVISSLRGKSSLMLPLIRLAVQPQKMQNALLPTMPQDDLEEVKEALEEGQFYRCPNGHPYIITECGRAWDVGICNECGEQIGGEFHHLLSNNVTGEGKDRTQTGHILGTARSQGRHALPERKMSPAACGIVRLLTHMAMYLGANKNVKVMHLMIRPAIKMTNVPEFLWAHIQLGLDQLHRVLNRSLDDVLQFMHAIVNDILSSHSLDNSVSGGICNLASKPDRSSWEEVFSARIVNPALQNTDAIITDGNRRILDDKRLGSDPLLPILFETDIKYEDPRADRLHDLPSVWRYHTNISIDHVRHDISLQIGTTKQYPVLEMFFSEDHNLSAIRYIPKILKLHRRLLQKYQRKLDKAEAEQITIETMLLDFAEDSEISDLVQGISEAWDLVREALLIYVVPTHQGKKTAPEQYCRQRISQQTSMSVLLPSFSGPGLCSYAMLDFLFRKQNDFLDKYCRETKQPSDSFPQVQVKDITVVQLISYHPEEDILPLVLANCKYFFEAGKGAKIEYDFKTLERQLSDKLFVGRSRIKIDKIEVVVFRANFTTMDVFQKLDDKIKQIPLIPKIKNKIAEESCQALDGIYLSLNNLDIAISFLKDIGGNCDQRLSEFMVETLKMKTPLTSQQARQSCQFQHVKALWFLLSLEKTKLMAKFNMSIFENLADEFHDEITEEVRVGVADFLATLQLEQLDCLLEVVFECATLVLAVVQNPDDENYVDTSHQRLRGSLFGYLSTTEDSRAEELGDLEENLAAFPEQVITSQLVSVWKIIYNTISDRQANKYRY